MPTDDATGHPERRWLFYTSPAGVDLVTKEIRKARLSADDLARLDNLLDRISGGVDLAVSDRTPVGGGVLEAHLDLPGARRSYRLCYALDGRDLVLLALHFFEKRSRRQQHDLDLAKKRFREWRRYR